jgi:hypothetical protein
MLRKSFTCPELSLTEKGEVFNNKTGEKVNLNFTHSLSVNGPAAYYKKGKKIRYVSVANMVFECFVIGGPLKRGQFVVFKDRNDKNLHYTNLILKDTKKTMPKEEFFEGFHNWNESALFC